MKRIRGCFLLLFILMMIVLLSSCRQQTLITTDVITGEALSVLVSNKYSWGIDTEDIPNMLVRREPGPFQDVAEDVKEKNKTYVFEPYGENFVGIQKNEGALEQYLLVGFDSVMNIWITSPQATVRLNETGEDETVYFPVQYLDWSKRDFSEYGGRFLISLNTGYACTQPSAAFRAFYANRPEIRLTDTEDGFQFAYRSLSGKDVQYVVHFLTEDGITKVTVTK